MELWRSVNDDWEKLKADVKILKWIMAVNFGLTYAALLVILLKV
ncbi:hypothetical protein [Labrys sp. (in: a-proteobacteria)]